MRFCATSAVEFSTSPEHLALEVDWWKKIFLMESWGLNWVAECVPSDASSTEFRLASQGQAGL